jgi:gamma-glutamyl:cysteine ligase YbdK (ATP-grasp superfamily)
MSKYKLFQGYGIELEYMLVDRDTLSVRPITDELLKNVLGKYGGDYENGMVTWSNELVMHVVELKCTKPEANLDALEKAFVQNITIINTILQRHNAMLMPSAAHPFMNPTMETLLWPHDNNEVYDIYNKIFDCRGHGWSNLQSTHLNLPFNGDEEFAKLHAAIRVLLPILPALCASSPILDGKPTGNLDTRLLYYKENQARIPSITGKVIPEPIFSAAAYKKGVYNTIENDIQSFNQNDILDPIWVNSRGAIPRFDRGSIEIRIMDIQECPTADLAIQTVVIETLKLLTNEIFFSREQQEAMDTEVLAGILASTAKDAGKAIIDDPSFLKGWGLKPAASATDVWRKILQTHKKNIGSPVATRIETLEYITEHGTLAERILRAAKGDYGQPTLIKIYRDLCNCLAQNKVFMS